MLSKLNLETFVLTMGIIEPLFTIPQGYNIWIRHDTTGVSLITWIFFVIAALIWFVYGLSIKSKPIIVSYALYFLFNSLIVLGLIIN